MQSDFLALAAKVFEQFFWQIIGISFVSSLTNLCTYYRFFCSSSDSFLSCPSSASHYCSALWYSQLRTFCWLVRNCLDFHNFFGIILVCRQSPKIFCIYLIYPLFFIYFCTFLWICCASAHHTFAPFLWMIHTHWVLCWGWHICCIEEKFCTFLPKLFAAEFFVLFSFGLFFPYILSVDVRFFLKGSCFIVIDLGLSLMGSFTHILSKPVCIHSVKIEF